LEDRLLLATWFYESFKTMEYTATGTFSGQTRGDFESPNDYHDDYSGEVSFSGEIEFSSNTTSEADSWLTFGNGWGEGQGVENCPPAYQVEHGYTFTFEATSEVSIDGPQIAIDISTGLDFNYGIAPCTLEYRAGYTPFDNVFEGTLDISSVPFKAVLESSSNVGGLSNTGTLELDIYPTSPPYGQSIDLRLFPFSNNLFGVDLVLAGAPYPAPSMTTPLSYVEVYFATGPDADDIFGTPIVSHPVYWNTYVISIDFELPANVPGEATHLVAMVDRHGFLPDHEFQHAVSSVGLPGEMTTHTFTAEVIEFSPGANPQETPNIAVGQTITGVVSYDANNPEYGIITIPLDGLPVRPAAIFYVRFDDYGDDDIAFSLAQSTYYEEWEFNTVDTILTFWGPGLIYGQMPLSLEGLQGEIEISSEISEDYERPGGFYLRATINSLASSSTLAGLSTEATLDEETTATIDLAELYASAGVLIKPGSISIVESPQNGALSIDTASGSIVYTPELNFAGVDSFSYVVRDAHNRESSIAQVLLTVIEVPEPYQNPAGPYRVTAGDPYVNSQDLAWMINELNATGMHILTPPAPGEVITLYLDINGDNIFSSLDVALMVNYLNAVGSEWGPLDDFVATSLDVPEPAAESTDDIDLLAKAISPLAEDEHVKFLTFNVAPPSDWVLALSVPMRAMVMGGILMPLPQESALASRTGRNAVDQLLSTPDDWWHDWAA
jgi:hypothetical protein